MSVLTAPKPTAVRSAYRENREKNGLVYGVVIAATALSLFPLIAIFTNSFRPNADIVSNPIGLPTSFYVDNYVSAWDDASLGYYFGTSVVIAAGALLLQMVLGLPLAYALGRWQFRGRSVINLLFLAGLMVPLRIGIVPLVRLYEDTGLLDTHLGLILVYAVSGLPMAVLVLSAFYAQLPQALEDAALVDGAGPFTIFWRIMTPLVKPATAAVLVLNVGPAWNDFFMPLILMRSRENYTLPVGITSFFGEHSADRGLLFAGIMIAVIPVIIFFSLAMKHIVRGLTAGIEK